MDISVLSVAQHRGNARVWLQGNVLLRSGWEQGTAYRIVTKEGAVIVSKTNEGINLRSVSGRKKKDTTIPIIDLNNAELTTHLQGLDRVRVVFSSEEIRILPLASDVRAKERVARAKSRIANGEPLKVGSLAHGGGVLSHALHKGFESAGVTTKLAFSNEVREDLTNHVMSENSLWDKDTISLNGPMQELAFDDWVMQQLGSDTDVLETGLPCSGVSAAWSPQRKSRHPEAHASVGHLVVAFLGIIARVNPSSIILENVPQYLNVASMDIIRNQLRDWGYILYEMIVRGEDWNAIEHRKRMVMVAVTKGMDFSFVGMPKPVRRECRVGEILEDISIDDPRWSPMTGLKLKEKRDAAAGKNFGMQIFDADDAYLTTLTKGIAKNRSTDAKIRHPYNDDLLRIPTPVEHGNSKQIPHELFNNLCPTVAHEVLGQSVNYEAFVSVGAMVGYSYVELGSPSSPSDSEPSLLESAAKLRAKRFTRKTLH